MFAVLAATTVTSTGPTVVHGNVGVFPGSACTGFPPGKAAAVHQASEAAHVAKAAAQATYDAHSALGTAYDLSGQDLGGLVLTPGVYRFGSSAQLTGTLTLKGNGEYTFIVASQLTTAPGAKVVAPPGAKVTWIVGSSAVLDTTTEFVGDVLTYASITLNKGAKVRGRLCALTAQVSLDSAEVSP